MIAGGLVVEFGRFRLPIPEFFHVTVWREGIESFATRRWGFPE